MEIKLYDKIFQVANGKMQEHGMEFSFDKKAFDCILYRNPNIIRVEEFLDLEPRDFVDAVYLRCLNRLPDTRAVQRMMEYMDGAEQKKLLRKYLLLMSINRSAEFKAMHKKIEGVEWLRAEVLKNSPFITRCRLRASEAKASVKQMIKKYLFLPIWNRFSLEKKMAIKSFVLREK